MKKGIEKSNSCDGKIAFPTLELANDNAMQLNIKSGGKLRVVSYKCYFCNGYHFGHENKKRKSQKDYSTKMKLDPKEYSTSSPALTKGYCIIKQTA